MTNILPPLIPHTDSNKQADHTWHKQQSKLLKSWGEIASSYRFLHNQSFMKYKKRNRWFLIPLIIVNTVSGTMSFSTTTFPSSIRPFVPQIVGALSLLSGIVTTIFNFLKISELMESHRIASISYGKLARNITTELNLPVKDREKGGADTVKLVRSQVDNLIESSPSIPIHIVDTYTDQFKLHKIAKPEILIINPIDIYSDTEDTISTRIAQAGVKFKDIIVKNKKNILMGMIDKIKSNVSESPIAKVKESRFNELDEINKSKLVSGNNGMKGILKNILVLPSQSPKPQEPQELQDVIINIESPTSESETNSEIHTNFISDTGYETEQSTEAGFESGLESEPEPEVVPQPEVAPGELSVIESDMELLNSSKLVSTLKK